MSASALDLAQALIRCPSVTPEDAGALGVVAGALAEAGFTVERPIFSEAGHPDTPNLFARIGREGPCLAFAGHTDVVPTGDRQAWRHDPFGAVIEGGMLYGRGAADMKGGVACMMAAALAFVEKRRGDVPGSIALLITGDEEGPAVNGTVKLLEWARAAGRALRPLPARRADQSRHPRRDDQDRPAGFAHGQAHGGSAGRATSPIRTRPRTRFPACCA